MSVFPAAYGLAPPPSTASPARGATILTPPASATALAAVARPAGCARGHARPRGPAPLLRHNPALGALAGPASAAASPSVAMVSTHLPGQRRLGDTLWCPALVPQPRPPGRRVTSAGDSSSAGGGYLLLY